MKLMISVLALCIVLGGWVAVGSPAAEAEGSIGLSTNARLQDEVSSRLLPSGVRAEKVKFISQGIRLAGTIVVPKLVAGKRAPAVLLISGANFHRSGKVPIARAPEGAFGELAANFTANGLVAFSYETQCNGASECRADSTPQDYAADAMAAFIYLSKRAEVDASRIVVLGHDEGGTFAASVAGNLPASDGKAFAVILVAVPGRTYGKILRDNAEKRLTAAGKPAAEIKSYLGQFDVVARALSSGSLDLKAANVDENDPLFSQFALNRQYLFHLFINDPLQIARGIEVPVLIVQGEKDAHIGVRDAQYLKESMDRQYNRAVTLEILPDMDHWMRAQKGGVVFRDEEAGGPLDPAFTAILNAWIAKRVK